MRIKSKFVHPYIKAIILLMFQKNIIKISQEVFLRSNYLLFYLINHPASFSKTIQIPHVVTL